MTGSGGRATGPGEPDAEPTMTGRRDRASGPGEPEEERSNVTGGAEQCDRRSGAM